VEATTATTDDVRAAVDAALRRPSRLVDAPWETRASVFLRAADLLSGPFPATVLNAARSWARARVSIRPRSMPPAS